jgi:glutamyl-tRNA synthetase
VEIDENLITSIALRNACEHDGKAKLDAVLSKVVGSEPRLREALKGAIPKIKYIVDEINRLDKEQQKKRLAAYILPEKIKKKEKTSLLPDLPDARFGEVVTRFPPEPNGYPHIGHAKAATINDEYSKIYNGKMVLRFDDTNPSNEKIEYYDAIKDGLEWLDIKPHLTKNTSDDIFELHEFGKKTIAIGYAYVCTCSSEIIHKNRANMIECNCRKYENQDRVDKFFNDNYSQNEAIIRLKGNMQDLNTVMRDPTLFRIVENPHPLLGSKVRIWPTYDFAVPIEDSNDGVTHALRTKEYELRNQLYYFILDILKLRKPTVIEFSRLEFEGIPVSKRKIKPLIDGGVISGWDDPRLPTLVGMRKRGFQASAIKKFVLGLGLTLAETKPPIETLESINRKLIDSSCMRLFFVENPVKLYVKNSNSEKVLLNNHPTRNLGKRDINISNEFYISDNDCVNLELGKTIRLMDLYNIQITYVATENGKKVIIASKVGDEIVQSMKKIQWVAKNDAVNYHIYVPRWLYIGDKYNTNSLEKISGYAESFVSKLSQGTVVQFVRFGFCNIQTGQSAYFTHR